MHFGVIKFKMFIIIVCNAFLPLTWSYVASPLCQVISHIVGCLSENGRPTLLIGPAGCGKSHIIRDRLLNSSSDVAEVQSLFVNANKFITSETLWKRMDEFLEWKHTRTFIPKGNKKLICLIDDINHCMVRFVSYVITFPLDTVWLHGSY